MKLKLKHRIRFHLGFLRQRTPEYSGKVKHTVWGEAEKEKRGEVPRIIWLYWDDENVTSITVKLCVAQIRALHPDYTVHLLNKNNLLDYLPDFPAIVLEKAANFASDLIRLMLLEKHGGIYLDATVLLTRTLDWALIQQKCDCSEAVVYYADENTIHAEFPMVETWFIIAKPYSQFISAWREEYQKCITSPDPENYYDNNSVLSLIEFPMDTSYYLSYLAGQIVMRKNQNYRLTLFRAEDDAFLYSLKIRRKWGEIAMAEIFLLNKIPARLPNVVKIIRFGRKRLDFLVQQGFYKKGSWFGRMLRAYNLK